MIEMKVGPLNYSIVTTFILCFKLSREFTCDLLADFQLTFSGSCADDASNSEGSALRREHIMQ